MSTRKYHVNGENLVIDVEKIDSQRLVVQGEKQSYVNKLSSWEMDSLISLCDSLLPTVDPSNSAMNNHEAVTRFYQTSVSMTGVAEHVGGMISERLRCHVFLARFLLFVLSFRIGTLVMGGGRSVTSRFPFFLKFSQLSLEKRQQILRSWSTSYFYLFRMAFVGLKLFILFAFFTKVDEKDENTSWEAIGYCGPDPTFKSKRRTQEQRSGPLYNGIISIKVPKEVLSENLVKHGHQVTLNRKNKQPNTPSMVIKCDAVVVGSGSGGGVVAGILASAGFKVIVIEKGEYYARENLSLLEGPTLDKMYEASGMLLTRDLQVAVLAGSSVGGGSTINWSASIRTPRHVLKEWAHGLELELFDSVLYKEGLDKVCDKMGVQQEVRANEGFNNAVLRKGCMELGYAVEDIPRNAPPDHDCGWCCLGCKDGKKQATTETWLKDMVDSGNGVILSGCEVTKVLYRRKRGRRRDTAIGVSFQIEYQGVKELCVVEAKETIVACGALNTPALLKRSGLKNPNIGKNLHLHPVVMAWGYFPETDPTLPLLSNEDGLWPEKEKKSYKGAIMSAMSTVVGNFEKSGYGAVIQTPSLHPGLFAALMPWTSGSDIKHRMTRFARTAHIFALARDIGSGTISTSPHDISYKMHSTDEVNLKHGIEKMLRILAAAGAEEIGTHHVTGPSINVKKTSCHEFEKFVKRESSRGIKGLQMPLASAHQMGSCKMGVDPQNSVVNQRGECWEVEGLYLADSSVLPTALGVNPMVTIQAIAYCTSQSILESLKRKLW